MEKALSLKIFLVDDDEITIKLTRFHLKRLGYADVSAFYDGTMCLNKLTDRPHVVFLDHNLDDLSGFEVLKKIKRFDPNIFVVMLSGQEKISTAVRALKYGAFDYITKGSDALDNVTKVLVRITAIMEKIKTSKPNIWKSLASFI